jgi:hypothetical protein
VTEEPNMTTPSTDLPQWVMVDEGWGRRAVDFATLSEPVRSPRYIESFAPADASG